ncbi:MAG: cyclodeaminase/cyclohydrolase family protein [Clostridiales Family XIII bacterium]|jgi:formiminotetrahydrofolate cyclodeaminase|nr:cyclodeaminase/cyclohydrolase family protein [Clostridiales Family XIII bacterium]
MLELTCSKFIDRLSSKEPVPGGGGASAYAGALGMALGAMVGNLTLGKEKYAAVQYDIQELTNRAQKLTGRFKTLVNQDAEAFLILSSAYRMPHAAEEEQHARNDAIQQALIAAAETPLEIAECCLEAIDLHEKYAKIGNTLAISDVGVGVILCKAALQGARLNVLINTKTMRDAEQKNRIESRLNEIEKIGSEKADCVYRKVETMLKTQ